MPLPANNSAWPPTGWANIRTRYSLHSAWYSGNPNRLATVYSAILDNNLFPEAKHWARMAAESRTTMLHMPLAGDISKTSASLLFSEHPKIRISEAFEEKAQAGAVKAQDRLELMIEEGAYHRVFHEAAESASAYGGVLVKINWDKALSEFPILSVVNADCAFPEFRFGIMTACTVWEDVETDGSIVKRWVERHEPGVILSGLYQGTTTTLGTQIPLESHERTKGMLPAVRTGLDGLAIVYVPNIRPNRDPQGAQDKWHGSSDYMGAETDMDALDNVYTQLVRDIDLGMTRIHVPERMIWTDPSDHSKKFKLDQEVYVGLAGMVDNPSNALSNTILPFQGAIRSEQLIASAIEMVTRIVSTRGYSSATFGVYNDTGGAESGTALRTKHMKSLSTTAQKAEYWLPALRYLMQAALIIDGKQLGSGVATDFRPSVEMQDSIPTDSLQTATFVKTLRDARSQSRPEAVKTVHPDWDEEQVAQEVKLLEDEDGAALPALPGETPPDEGNDTEGNDNED